MRDEGWRMRGGEGEGSRKWDREEKEQRSS